MAMLEAELEAELERLEHNLDSTGSFPDQLTVSDIDEAELKNFSNSGMNTCVMHETWDIDKRDNSSDQGFFTINYGVSPIELDRRLHEVLEEQQRKRILELETLLKETKSQLLNKEQEILFWKDRSHELTKCFQSASAYGTEMLTLNCSNNKDSFLLQHVPAGDLLPIRRNTLQMPQDPEISSQMNHVKKSSSGQQRNLGDSSICRSSLLCEELLEPSFFEDPVDLVKIVTESHATWHIQGRGIDTPEINDRSMRKIEVHTPMSLTSKILRSQSVSRASEMSDLSQLDDLDSARFPSCQVENGHTNPSFGKVDSTHMEGNINIKTREVCDVQVDSCFSTSKPCSGAPKNQFQVMNDTSAANGYMDIEGNDCFDIMEQIVDFSMSDFQSHSPKVPQARRLINPQQAAKAPRQSSKLKSESLHVITTGLRRSFNAQESPSGLESPVLDKIRHWEALGRGKDANNQEFQ